MPRYHLKSGVAQQTTIYGGYSNSVFPPKSYLYQTAGIDEYIITIRNRPKGNTGNIFRRTICVNGRSCELLFQIVTPKSNNRIRWRDDNGIQCFGADCENGRFAQAA